MNLRIRTVVVTVLVVAVTALNAWAATPVKLVDTRADEGFPSIVDGWLGWSTFGTRDVVWLDPTGPDGARKIPTAYDAYLGDIVVDGPRAGQAAFWQFEGRNGQIRFFDLNARTIVNPPAGVNTRKSEEFVSMSGNYLLFGRGPLAEPAPRQVVLYDFAADTTTTIASANAPTFYPDQVNGDHVVYTRFTRAGTDVYRYRVSTGRSTKIPSAPEGRANYSGSVLADGTVFYVQGNARLCGKNTKIMRLRDGNVTSVASVPDGVELAHLNAREIGGEVHVAFRRLVCSTGKGGIYEIVL